MLDQMNRNPMTVSGSPPLVDGLLTIDTDQALQFDGSTDSASAADSPSLSITGSLSLELLIELPSIPGSTKTIYAKAGSYTIQVNSSGKLLFKVENGASSVTVTSVATLLANVPYLVGCVYNEGYSGTEQFGQASHGADSARQAVNDDTKYVTSFELPETALLNTVYLSLNYPDEVHAVDVIALVYADEAGAPGALVAQSAPQNINDESLWRNPTFVAFPVAAVVPAGTYWLGFMGLDPYPGAGLYVTGASSGGTTKSGADTFSDGAEDPFGTVAGTTADLLSVYATYSAVGRTGLEGKAAIYLNGAVDQSAAYTDGIADTANAFQHATTDAAVIADELSIWDRALTAVEFANHYRAL